MTLRDQGFWDKFQFWKNEETTIKEELKSILNPFRKECRELGFSFELNESHFMLFLTTGKSKNSPEYIKSSILKELNKKDNFKFIEVVDPF